MKSRIDAIKNAYNACIPRIVAEDEVKDDAICLAITDFERQLNDNADSDTLPIQLAVAYVEKLSEHIDLLVKYVENDPQPKTNSDEFYRLAGSFLQLYQPTLESKYHSGPGSSPSAFDHTGEHKYAPTSPTKERISPRQAKENKYEQKSESRPKSIIKPVKVNEDLRASGNQFRQQIGALKGNEVAKLLGKHGFLAGSQIPAKAMAYQLLTQGDYKIAPSPSNQKRVPKEEKGDFELAKQLQDEEIGWFFRS